MSRVIDATLRFVDRFTSPMNQAVKSMERSAKQAQRMGKEIEKSGKKISDVGSGLTKGITVPVLAAGAASFKLASDLNESINKTDVTFKKNANNVKNWSKTTLKSYGIAQGTALDMASTYGDMATSMGLSTSKSAKMSKSLVGLAGDLASFKNISIETANTALNGIFSGETESLKQLGIVMTDTNLEQYALNKGMLKSTVSSAKMKAASVQISIAQQNLAKQIKKHGSASLEAKKAQISLNNAMEKRSKISKGSYKDLSQEQKVMLRYKYVTDMTKNSHKDFAKTSAGAANQQRIFKEGLKQLGATMGTKILPMGTKLITWANNMIDKFSNLTGSQQNMVIKVLGIAAAIGPVILIFGKLTSGVGALIRMFGIAGQALKIFRAQGLLAMIGPQGLVIAGIAAVALAAFLIIKNWGKLKAFFGKFVNYVKGIFKRCGGDSEKFAETFGKVKVTVGKIVNVLGLIFKKIITFLKPIGKFLVTGWINYFKVAFTAVVGGVSGALEGIRQYIDGIMKVFNGIIKFVQGVFTGNWKQAWEGVKEIFGGIFESLGGLMKIPINAVIGLINGAIYGINKLGLKIPDWVPGIGGKDFSINIPKIPMLARGTNSWRGGLAMTQERGGEIMDLPRGTRVYPHDKSLQMARNEGAKSSKNEVKIIINKIADKVIIRDDSDIDKIAEALAKRLETTCNNMSEVVME